jgi:hypothetical protein
VCKQRQARGKPVNFADEVAEFVELRFKKSATVSQFRGDLSLQASIGILCL